MVPQWFVQAGRCCWSPSMKVEWNWRAEVVARGQPSLSLRAVVSIGTRRNMAENRVILADWKKQTRRVSWNTCAQKFSSHTQDFLETFVTQSQWLTRLCFSRTGSSSKSPNASKELTDPPSERKEKVPLFSSLEKGKRWAGKSLTLSQWQNYSSTLLCPTSSARF